MEKPIPTKIFRPITAGADIVLKRLEFLAIPRNLFKARGKLCVKGEIGFVSHWLKSWCDIYSQNSRRSCPNYAITEPFETRSIRRSIRRLYTRKYHMNNFHE